MAEFLELAANAYLERSPEQMQRELEQLLEAEQFSIDPSKPLPKNVRKAAISLEKSPAEAGGNSQQGQLDSSSLAEEPAATASDEAPASRRLNAGGQEQQAGNTKTSGKSKRSPGARAKTRKTTTG
jgi:hypothetical protein